MNEEHVMFHHVFDPENKDHIVEFLYHMEHGYWSKKMHQEFEACGYKLSQFDF